jgi:hypothetical protein
VDYCRLAEECFVLAATARDSGVAAELVKAGDDYMRLAGESVMRRLVRGFIERERGGQPRIAATKTITTERSDVSFRRDAEMVRERSVDPAVPFYSGAEIPRASGTRRAVTVPRPCELPGCARGDQSTTTST